MRDHQIEETPAQLDALASQVRPLVRREEQRSETQARSFPLAEKMVSPAPTRGHHRRTLTILALVGILVFAGVFFAFTLLPSPTPTPVAGVRVGAAAPLFVLPIYGGSGYGSIDLRALRGHPVMINFWSESCPSCVAETPLLEQTYRQYSARGALILLGINQADPRDDIAPFGRHYHITFPLLFDPGGQVSQVYKVTALPVTYFLDANGIVRAAFVTELTLHTIQQGLASVGISHP